MKHRISIGDMRCAGCVAAVESALKAVPGVCEATVNFADHSAQVAGDVEAGALIAAVEAAGYTAAVLEEQDDGSEAEQAERAAYHRLLYKSLVAGAVGFPLVIAGWLDWLPVIDTNRGFWLTIAGFSLAAMVYAGNQYYRGAVRSWRHPNMDTLVAIGTGAAWTYSMVVTLFPEAVPSLARYAYFEAALVILSLLHSRPERADAPRRRSSDS